MYVRVNCSCSFLYDTQVVFSELSCLHIPFSIHSLEFSITTFHLSSRSVNPLAVHSAKSLSTNSSLRHSSARGKNFRLPAGPTKSLISSSCSPSIHFHNRAYSAANPASRKFSGRPLTSRLRNTAERTSPLFSKRTADPLIRNGGRRSLMRICRCLAAKSRRRRMLRVRLRTHCRTHRVSCSVSFGSSMTSVSHSSRDGVKCAVKLSSWCTVDPRL